MENSMLLEFFLEQARIELSKDGTRFIGSVPDLPEVRVEAETAEQCHLMLAGAIADVLARERKEIIYENRDWVARVTINRPDVYNAYSSATLIEMAEAFRDAAADDHVAVLVLTGAGDRAFCTGSDIKEHVEEHLGRPEALWKWLGLLIEAHDALRHLGKPAIARINGIVAAGGNEWNLACDIAVAADHAKFLQIETSVGTLSAGSAAQWLPLVIGDRRCCS
jgi:enoyl-CoA hydratase/carnithine racemase